MGSVCKMVDLGGGSVVDLSSSLFLSGGAMIMDLVSLSLSLTQRFTTGERKRLEVRLDF